MKVEGVERILSKVDKRDRCVFKLFFYFFNKEELVTSNIDGIYNKKCLDVFKLNFLKVLVFSKFFVSFFL